MKTFSHREIRYLHAIFCNLDFWTLTYSYRSSRDDLKLLAENASFTWYHVMPDPFSITILVSEKTRKFIGVLSIASLMLHFLVSFRKISWGS